MTSLFEKVNISENDLTLNGEAISELTEIIYRDYLQQNKDLIPKNLELIGRLLRKEIKEEIIGEYDHSVSSNINETYLKPLLQKGLTIDDAVVVLNLSANRVISYIGGARISFYYLNLQ